MATAWNDDPLVRRLKLNILTRRGTAAFVDLVHHFRGAANERFVDAKTFTEAFHQTGTKATDAELKQLVKSLDIQRNGTVSLDEFIRHLIGGLNPRRQRVVDAAREKLFLRAHTTSDAKTAGETIPLNTLSATYRADRHLLVEQKHRTSDQVLADLLVSFPPGVQEISSEDFQAYYAGISTAIPHDDEFEALVLRTWEIDQPSAPRLDATARDWSATVTRADPLDVAPLIRVDLLSNTLGRSEKSYNASHMTRKQPHIEPNPSVRPDYVTTMKHHYPPYDAQQIRGSDPMRAWESSISGPVADRIYECVRQKIVSQGDGEGVLPLRRSLAEYLHRNQSLTKAELQDHLKAYGVTLSGVELQALASRLCPGQSQPYSITPFFYAALRDPISSGARLKILKAAFDRLRGTKNAPTMGELVAKFDPAGPTSVRSGAVSSTVAKQRLINDFGHAEGEPVSWEEFVEYYSDVSCGIPQDHEFELLIRTTWHVSTPITS